MTIKVKKLNFIDILFLLLLLASEQFFYLFELPISNSDIAVVIAMLMLAIYVVIYRCKGIKETPKEVIGLLAVGLICIIMSAVQGYRNYGQSLLLGLLPQRMYIIFLVYFPVKNVIMKSERGIKFAVNSLVAIGTIAAIIYIMQYFLFSGETFLVVNHDYRFSDVRLRFAEEITLFSMFYSYYQILNKVRLRWALNFAMHIFYYIVIIKGRTGFVVIVATLIVIAIIFNRKKLKGVLMLSIIALVLLYAPIPIMNDYFEGITDAVDSYQSEEDVRYKGQNFYLTEIAEESSSLILGKGYVNLNSDSATRISKADEYYVVDNGYFGVVYYYGLLGVIWNVWLYLYMIKKAYSWCKEEKGKEDVGTGMSIVFLAGSILCPYIMYYHAFLPMIVVLALPDIMHKRKKKRVFVMRKG